MILDKTYVFAGRIYLAGSEPSDELVGVLRERGIMSQDAPSDAETHETPESEESTTVENEAPQKPVQRRTRKVNNDE